MHPLQEIIDEARANRSAFLKPYQEKFEGAITRAAKAAIIIELMEIEPSHLSEEWVVNETISWLRDCHNCRDYIEKVFMQAPQQPATTEKQRVDDAGAYLLKRKLSRFRKQYELDSDEEALATLLTELGDAGLREYMGWDFKDSAKHGDIEKSMLDFINRAKARISGLEPPYPYYGRDILETDGKFKLFGE